MAKKRIQAAVFALVAIVLFWLVYRNSNFKNIYTELNQFSFIWIALSIGINLASQYIRAIRWNILLRPLGYRPRTSILFLSVLILGFTNQVIPRGGEVARLGVVNRYEHISVAKLTGVALAERLVDLVLLLIIFAAVIVWQQENFQAIINLPDISYQNINPLHKLLILSGIVLIIVLAVWLTRRFKVFRKLRSRIEEAKQDFNKGFGTIRKIKQKAVFLGLSVSVYALWFAMSYVLFFSYPPTTNLGAGAAAFTFGLATMAFLLPVQAGMGAWHFIVVQCLLLFGVEIESGKTFALVAHASTNLIYLLFGVLSFAILPFMSKAESQAEPA